jgi:transposase InsO family protein
MSRRDQHELSLRAVILCSKHPKRAHVRRTAWRHKSAEPGRKQHPRAERETRARLRHDLQARGHQPPRGAADVARRALQRRDDAVRRRVRRVRLPRAHPLLAAAAAAARLPAHLQPPQRHAARSPASWSRTQCDNWQACTGTCRSKQATKPLHMNTHAGCRQSGATKCAHRVAPLERRARKRVRRRDPVQLVTDECATIAVGAATRAVEHEHLRSRGFPRLQRYA